MFPFFRDPYNRMASWPQTTSIGDVDGRCIVDFVARFGDLRGGMRTLHDLPGVALPRLGRHNPSTVDRSLTELFRDEAAYDHLNQLHSSDCELFGYDRTLPLTTRPL